jgi:ubiquinone/menaquinone biosynthesis C-methylase UbiE
LKPGDALPSLACGRAGYGLAVTRGGGARLVGIDVSAEALAQAREQAARPGVADAGFRVGDLTASGLPDASADAVLCTDAIQFSDDPSAAYREIRRILKAGGRVALTCWEPVDRDDERLPVRLRRVDLTAGLAEAGFT